MNAEQKKHLADSFRIVGMAYFGYYGYDALIAHPIEYVALIMAGLEFLGFEYLAVAILGD